MLLEKVSSLTLKIPGVLRLCFVCQKAKVHIPRPMLKMHNPIQNIRYFPWAKFLPIDTCNNINTFWEFKIFQAWH